MRMLIEEPGDSRGTNIGTCKIQDMDIINHASGKLFIRYLFEDLPQKLADDMHKNCAANYDNVVMIEGGEGSGKSNLAYHVCKCYDPSFNLQESYVYSMDELKDRFARKDYGSGIFWMDETSNMANNRDWQSQSNKDIVSILETMRSKKFLFVGCIPHIERLDIYIREFRMRYKLTCHAMAFPSTGLKDRGYFELSKRDIDGRMHHTGYGTYPAMPSEASEIYEAIKLQFQESKLEEIGNGGKKSNGGKYKEMYETAQKRATSGMLHLREAGTFTDEELMVMFGYENKKTFFNALSKAREREA